MTASNETQNVPDFRAEFLANAEAWRDWLEYLRMKAEGEGDDMVVARADGELNMLSIMVEMARATPCSGHVFSSMTKRFAQSDTNVYELGEKYVYLNGSVPISRAEHALLSPLLGAQ